MAENFVAGEEVNRTAIGLTGHSGSHRTLWRDSNQTDPGSPRAVHSYFSIFKRGMKGAYQHCGKNHLHRYAAEFEFRYNNRKAPGVEDGARANAALLGVIGKRLTNQTISV